jgi:hypothetical protein
VEKERRIVPWGLFLLLGALALGAAVLGLYQQPASADLSAHNAVGENLLAPSFAGVAHQAEHGLGASSAPVVLTFHYDASAKGLSGSALRRQIIGSQTRAILAGVYRLKNWTATGDVFHTGSRVVSTGGVVTERYALTIDQGYVHRLTILQTLNGPQAAGSAQVTISFATVAGTTLG